MTATYLIRLRDFVLFILVQVLIFSHIHLFGYATACIALIFVLKLPRHTSRNELLIWGFLLGLAIDIFGSTPGMNAAAFTALAFIRNSLLENFIPKGFADDITPGISTIKTGRYLSYTSICVLLFYTVLYLLELFTIHYPLPLLIGAASSTLLTMLFVIIAEFFTRK